MKLINKSQSGFTLIELVLTMMLFSTVLLITTVGFIGMNRIYIRGTIKKQLSESVQAVSDDMTREIRANGGAGTTNCAAGACGIGGSPGADAERLCIGKVRYIWQLNGSHNGG